MSTRNLRFGTYYLETVVGRGYRCLEGRDGRALFPDTTGPVAGRESQLSRLEDYYQISAEGHRQFVLLSDEPGIGKTTLLSAFLDQIAEQTPARAVQCQCVVHYGKGEALGALSVTKGPRQNSAAIQLAEC